MKAMPAKPAGANMASKTLSMPVILLDDDNHEHGLHTLPLPINPISPYSSPRQDSDSILSANSDHGFDIDIVYSGEPRYRQYLDRAVEIWETVITGDLPDVQTKNRYIDDLVIDVTIAKIDGPFNTLGIAGPSDLRYVPQPYMGGLPYSGELTLDTEDIERLEDQDILTEVFLHEIGHILGIGSLWRFPYNESETAYFGGPWDGYTGNWYAQLHDGDYNYIGFHGVRQYNSYRSSPIGIVPVQDEGITGSVGTHWRESWLKTELMTPEAEERPPMPLSRVTIGSLEDLGYKVNYNAADPYSLYPPKISISLTPTSVVEDGNESLVYLLSRTGPTNFSLDVNYEVAGTATANVDYTGIPNAGSLQIATFAIGEDTTTINVVPTADSQGEPDETVSIKLRAGVGYTRESTDPLVGTILNDDPVGTVSVNAARDQTQEDGSGFLSFLVTRTGPLTSGLDVDIAIEGTATAGSDYEVFPPTATSGTISFQPNFSTYPLLINPIDDAVYEENETVSVRVLPRSGYEVGSDREAVGTIINDDTRQPQITLSVTPERVAEDGAQNLVFIFRRTGEGLSSPLNVSYGVGGTATLGNDYTGISQLNSIKTASFPAGASVTGVIVNPTADSISEQDETVTLRLTSGEGYEIATTAPVTGTIEDDDQIVMLPKVSLDLTGATTIVESRRKSRANLLRFKFDRDNADGFLSVKFSVGGTATPGKDYNGIKSSAPSAVRTITFKPGQKTVFLSVSAKADRKIEPNETVELALLESEGYEITTPDPVVGTILANLSLRASSGGAPAVSVITKPSSAHMLCQRCEEDLVTGNQSASTNAPVLEHHVPIIAIKEKDRIENISSEQGLPQLPNKQALPILNCGVGPFLQPFEKAVLTPGSSFSPSLSNPCTLVLEN